MKIVYSDKHAQHDPQTFVVRGVKQRSAEQPERATRLLKAHEPDLHTLARELLDKETLSGGEIAELVGKGAVNSEACSRLSGGRGEKNSSSSTSGDNESGSSSGGSDGGKGVTAAQGGDEKARRPVQPGAVAPAAFKAG